MRKVLESRTFKSTEVLKRLLEYLAGVDPQAELKEYTVGVEAFGKPRDYDPQTDSSVRVQAGKLRKKLDEYYRTEGIGDPLTIELPRGQFKIEVRPRAEPPETAKPARRTAALLAIGLCVAFAFGFLLRPWVSKPAGQPLAAMRWSSEMDEIWRPFLSTQRPILISLGAPLFTKVGNSFFREPGLNNWDAAPQSDDLNRLEHAFAGSAVTPAFTYTGVGEALGAFALARLILPRGRDLRIEPSNVLGWEDIAANDVIFLGPPKYNLQIPDLPVRQEFEISHGHVRYLRPAEGSPDFFEEKWAADRTLEEGHALISRLPGLHGVGEMLILAGSSTESTRAAVEYMTRGEYVEPFVRWLRQTYGAAPPWFQVVVRARFKSGTPISIERVAFRRLQ